MKQLLPGIYTWVSENGLGAFCVQDGGVSVLIDPVPLDGEGLRALEGLGRPVAIVLTCNRHERASAFYRTRYGAEIWVPSNEAWRLDTVREDHTYDDGDALPGGLRAIDVSPGTTDYPGGKRAESNLFLERWKGVLIVGDALGTTGKWVTDEGLGLGLHPLQTAASLHKLLGYDFDALLVSHGPPILQGAKEKVRQVLQRSAG